MCSVCGQILNRERGAAPVGQEYYAVMACCRIRKVFDSGACVRSDAQIPGCANKPLRGRGNPFKVLRPDPGRIITPEHPCDVVGAALDCIVELLTRYRCSEHDRTSRGAS